jgi:hypothetical protein
MILLLLLVAGAACRLPAQKAEDPSSPPPLPGTAEAEPQPADQGAALSSQALSKPDELTHYLIQANLDYSLGTFSARAAVDYINNEADPLESLFFRLYPNAGSVYGDGWLTVTGVQLNGTALEPRLTLLDTVLEVPLPAPLSPGGRAQVVIDYNGVVPRDFGTSGYGIYNLTEGVLALAGWYPILAVYDQQGWNLDPVMPIGDPVYSEIALYTVDLTAANEVAFATTGVEVGRLEQDDTTTHRFASGPARDFFIAASSEFASLQAQEGGTLVSSTYLPGHEAAAQKALEVTQEALRVYTERFGPYPYSELDVVQAPMNHASGVEYPGIFLVKSGLYDDPQGLNFLFTVVHEVAHQWWYATVGNDVIEEPWLDEAMATYSSGLYLEVTGGKEFYQGVVFEWQNTYANLVSAGRDQPVTDSLADFVDSDGGGEYGSVVYIKGALALHELRQTIGDQVFFQALQDYYRQHYFVVGTKGALLAAFEQFTSQELDGFYQQWLFSATFPPTETPLPTETPTPTDTLVPTETPTPTYTLVPTDTPVPTETPTETPEPSFTPPPPPPPSSGSGWLRNRGRLRHEQPVGSRRGKFDQNWEWNSSLPPEIIIILMGQPLPSMRT